MHTFTTAEQRHRCRAAVVAAATLPLLLGPGAALASSPTDSTSARPTSGPVGGPRLTGTGVIVDRAAPRLPYVPSRTWVVADAATGAVLAAKGPHERVRPASTLKTLLALTMLPRLSTNSTYTATRQDVNVEGSKVGLVAGRRYVIDDLFYGLFLKSGNDAANAIARAGAHGSWRRAIRMMQSEARRLRAYDTTVVNPSGLDEPRQFSSAYDLALWGRAAIARSDVRRWTSTPRTIFPRHRIKGGQQKRYPIYTTNRLLGQYYGAFGVKTGYTTLARNTLIASATRNGRTFVVVLMGSERRTAPQAASLLNWAFDHGKWVKPVGFLAKPIELPAVSTQGRDLAVAPSNQAERATRRGRRRTPRV